MPMWSRKEAPDMVRGQYQLVFNHSAGEVLELNLVSQPVLLETPNLTLVLLGRIRPYNQDYPLVPDLNWLAQLWCNTLGEQLAQSKSLPACISKFYQQIAGFFTLLVLEGQGQVHILTDHVGSLPVYIHRASNQLWL